MTIPSTSARTRRGTAGSAHVARLTVALCAAGLLAACGGKDPGGDAASNAAGEAAAAVAPATPERDPQLVPAGAITGGLAVDRPSTVLLSESIRVPARIEVDGQRVARVGATVTGRVIDIDVLSGAEVRRGQVLARVSSVDLSATQLGLLKAVAQADLAQRAVGRARQLLDADVIGIAEMQRRESELVQAEADVSAFRGQLKVLGMSPASIERLLATRQIESVTQVVSSLSGTLIERKVTTGQVVQPADPMFLVADLANVWLVADVPEQRAGGVAVGTRVTAEVAALSQRPLEGTLSFVAATVDPAMRTVLVRMNLPNPRGEYRPAMLATMTLPGTPQPASVVPASAVIEQEGREHLYVAEAGGYRLRQVTLGIAPDGMRRVVSGLAADERVVIEGARALEAERRRLNGRLG